MTPLAAGLSVEIIDAIELARRWKVPVSWVRSQVQPSRTSSSEQIPHVQLGRYCRFEWGSEALEGWWARRRQGAARNSDNRPNNSGRREVRVPLN